MLYRYRFVETNHYLCNFGTLILQTGSIHYFKNYLEEKNVRCKAAKKTGLFSAMSSVKGETTKIFILQKLHDYYWV